MKKLFTILLCTFTCLSALAASGFSSLEEQMTGKEFEAAGLNKLSPSELDVLNGWIRQRSLATLDGPGSAAAGKSPEDKKDKRGLKKDDDKERTTITSNLVGKFDGWDGQTTFKLANGMIWAQADKDKFYIKEVKDPVVVIEPGMFGTWHLHIEGYDSECRVKRIQ